MRAAGHFRLLHGFLLRLSPAAPAAAAGQFVSVPALSTRDPLSFRVLLQPIQSFARGEFSASLVSADGVPLLLDGGGDVLADGADLAGVGLLLVIVVVNVLDIPEASGLPDRGAPDPEVKPSQAQVKRRHVRPTEEGDLFLYLTVYPTFRGEGVRQLRRDLDSAVAAGRQWTLPLQCLRPLLQDEWDQQAPR